MPNWIVVQFRPCTGGKFLCSALLTIDAIAHWDEQVENNKRSFYDWADEQWLETGRLWLKTEPMHSWNLVFFSRTMPRGNDLLQEEFNALVKQQASKYFKTTNKFVLDFYHRATMPVWWKDAFVLKLDATLNCEIHKKMLLSKLFPYNKETSTGISMLDNPDPNALPPPTTAKFDNKYVYTEFKTIEDWYKFVWQDPRINFEIDSPDIFLQDLISYKKLENFINFTAMRLGSKVNKKQLKYIWNIWMKSNRDCL